MEKIFPGICWGVQNAISTRRPSRTNTREKELRYSEDSTLCFIQDLPQHPERVNSTRANTQSHVDSSRILVLCHPTFFSIQTLCHQRKQVLVLSPREQNARPAKTNTPFLAIYYTYLIDERPSRGRLRGLSLRLRQNLGPQIHVLLLHEVPGLVLEQTVLAGHTE